MSAEAKAAVPPSLELDAQETKEWLDALVALTKPIAALLGVPLNAPPSRPAGAPGGKARLTGKIPCIGSPGA